MFKYKKTIAFIFILLGLVGYFFYLKSKPKQAEYTTVRVVKKNLSQTISVTGRIASPNDVDLSFQTSGQLMNIFVDVGDSVSEGQVIAQIESQTLLHELNQARAELKAQKETLEDMKNKRSIYTQEQRDSQRAIIKRAESVIAGVEKRIGETKIYSPINGIVGKRNFNVGETVLAGTAVVTLFQNEELEVSANVPESDIVKIELGQNAELTLDALPTEEKLLAQVIEIEPSATVIQDVVYYKIKLKLEKQDARLKNGMSVDVDVRSGEMENVLVAPIRAVKIEGTEKFVEVLKPQIEGKILETEKKKVEIGLDGDDGLVEIKSGLKEGDEAVTFVKEK